jgi:hypothetical protein
MGPNRIIQFALLSGSQTLLDIVWHNIRVHRKPGRNHSGGSGTFVSAINGPFCSEIVRKVSESRLNKVLSEELCNLFKRVAQDSGSVGIQLRA